MSYLAAMAPDAGWGEVLLMLLTGQGMTLIILSVLWIVCLVVARFSRWVEQRQALAGPRPAVDEQLEGSPEPVVAAIAAAVACVLPGAFRIESIRPIGPKPNPVLNPWSAEGRRDLFRSHRVR